MVTRFERQRVSGIPDRVVAKWSPEVLREGFVAFPKRLLRCLPEVLSGPNAINELRVVLAVADFRRPNMVGRPSAAYLAFIAGMPEDEFLQVARELHDQGLVVVKGDPESLDVSLEPLLEKVLRETTEKE